MTNLTDLTVKQLTIGGVATSQALTDSGAITIKHGVVTLSKAGVIAATIAKPTATTDDYKRVTIVSLTAQAHTVAVTAGSFGNGGVGADLCTFAVVAGDSLSLMAYQGQWYITGSNGATIS